MIKAEEKYPLLSKIDSPADLRKLPLESLPQVCDEIREFLIKELSVNPGHFASSMGAVELTVALHYVFDTPYDRIVWDVGHQAYGHKILTGRRDAFHTNRKKGGLSGFPNPDESEYDTFTAGHASNSISAALGMAVASQLQKDKPPRNVIAVIGDASISGGLAFEGLNNVANTPNNLLVILNDNHMSIDANVGSLNSYMSHITTSKAYNTFRYKAFLFLKKLRLISDNNRARILRFNNSVKSLVANEQNIFEGLNIRYFGPFDGHDIQKIVRILVDIKDMKGPRMLHLRTIKGKGFKPAEMNPADWHAPGKFDPLTGQKKSEKTIVEKKPLKYQDVFGRTLLQLAESNDKIVAITAAMSSGTSVSIMQKALPDRVFDVGISEGHAVTFAGGLAKDGMRPVVAIYSSFLQRAYDNIIHDVAIQKLPVVFCIDRAGLVGEDGVTHHGAFDLAYMRTVPNMIVSAPSDEHTLRNLMYTALNSFCGPFSIRYPRGGGNNADWDNQMKALEIGKSRMLTEEEGDVAILSIGTIAKEASEAAKMAFKKGIKVEHHDMLFLKPIDVDLLDNFGKRGIPIVTVEDGTEVGGLGSAVLEYFAEKGFSNKVKVIGIPDKFIEHGTVEELKSLCGLDSESIAAAVEKAVES